MPGNLANQEILNRCCLNKQPYRNDRNDHNEQECAGYFPEFSQAEIIGVKVTINKWWRKFSTIEL